MTLADALECIAVLNHVFQLGYQMFPVLVLLRFTALGVKTSTIQDPNIKTVSFIYYQSVLSYPNCFVKIFTNILSKYYTGKLLTCS